MPDEYPRCQSQRCTLRHASAFRKYDYDVALCQPLGTLLCHCQMGLARRTTIQADHVEATQHPTEERNTQKVFLEHKADASWKQCEECKRLPRGFMTAQDY